jgi:hypothetical protein
MTALHPAGHNVLPRDNPDWTALEAHYAHQPPALTVVFLERSGIDRLRTKSPHTLYIYRHAVPGKDNDDDVQVTYPDAAGFVDYLHARAPDGAALSLGNEPGGNLAVLAAWTISALNRCDELGRIGVALNLSYGNPEPGDWTGALKPVLDRLANTHHILGLHEYWSPGTLGKGYWTSRWVGHIPRSVRVAITELGALGWNDQRTDLNARKGWRKLDNYPASAYATDLKAVIDDYLTQPNFVGACIFSAGNWNGCETGEDLYDELEKYEASIPMPDTPDYGTPMLNGTMTLLGDTKGVNFRKTPSAGGTFLGVTFRGGEKVSYGSKAWEGWWQVMYNDGVLGYVSATYAQPTGGQVDDADPHPPVELPELTFDLEERVNRTDLATFLRALADVIEHGVIQTS